MGNIVEFSYPAVYYETDDFCHIRLVDFKAIFPYEDRDVAYAHAMGYVLECILQFISQGLGDIHDFLRAVPPSDFKKVSKAFEGTGEEVFMIYEEYDEDKQELSEFTMFLIHRYTGW